MDSSSLVAFWQGLWGKEEKFGDVCIKGLKLGIDGRRVDFCGYLPLEQKGGGRSGIAVCL